MQISSGFTPFFVKAHLKLKEENQKEQEKANSSLENLAQKTNELTKNSQESKDLNKTENSQKSEGSSEDGMLSALYKRLQQIYQQLDKLQAQLESQDDISARNSILTQIMQLNGEAQEINKQIQKVLEKLFKSLQKSA